MCSGKPLIVAEAEHTGIFRPEIEALAGDGQAVEAGRAVQRKAPEPLAIGRGVFLEKNPGLCEAS